MRLLLLVLLVGICGHLVSAQSVGSELTKVNAKLLNANSYYLVVKIRMFNPATPATVLDTATIYTQRSGRQFRAQFSKDYLRIRNDSLFLLIDHINQYAFLERPSVSGTRDNPLGFMPNDLHLDSLILRSVRISRLTTNSDGSNTIRLEYNPGVATQTVEINYNKSSYRMNWMRVYSLEPGDTENSPLILLCTEYMYSTYHVPFTSSAEAYSMSSLIEPSGRGYKLRGALADYQFLDNSWYRR
jgi:hypothetical protein